MSVARTRSVALLGLAGSIVEVEADLSSQLPGFVIIGLPDAALGEAATILARALQRPVSPWGTFALGGPR